MLEDRYLPISPSKNRDTKGVLYSDGYIKFNTVACLKELDRSNNLHEAIIVEKGAKILGFLVQLLTPTLKEIFFITTERSDYSKFRFIDNNKTKLGCSLEFAREVQPTFNTIYGNPSQICAEYGAVNLKFLTKFVIRTDTTHIASSGKVVKLAPEEKWLKAELLAYTVQADYDVNSKFDELFEQIDAVIDVAKEELPDPDLAIDAALSEQQVPTPEIRVFTDTRSDTSQPEVMDTTETAEEDTSESETVSEPEDTDQEHQVSEPIEVEELPEVIEHIAAPVRSNIITGSSAAVALVDPEIDNLHRELMQPDAHMERIPVPKTSSVIVSPAYSSRTRIDYHDSLVPKKAYDFHNHVWKDGYFYFNRTVNVFDASETAIYTQTTHKDYGCIVDPESLALRRVLVEVTYKDLVEYYSIFTATMEGSRFFKCSTQEDMYKVLLDFDWIFSPNCISLASKNEIFSSIGNVKVEFSTKIVLNTSTANATSAGELEIPCSVRHLSMRLLAYQLTLQPVRNLRNNRITAVSSSFESPATKLEEPLTVYKEDNFTNNPFLFLSQGGAKKRPPIERPGYNQTAKIIRLPEGYNLRMPRPQKVTVITESPERKQFIDRLRRFSPVLILSDYATFSYIFKHYDELIFITRTTDYTVYSELYYGEQYVKRDPETEMMNRILKELNSPQVTSYKELMIGDALQKELDRIVTQRKQQLESIQEDEDTLDHPTVSVKDAPSDVCADEDVVPDTTPAVPEKKNRTRRTKIAIQRDCARIRELFYKGLSLTSIRLVLGREEKIFFDDMTRLNFFIGEDKSSITRTIISASEPISAYRLEDVADYYELLTLEKDGKKILQLVPLTKDELLAF